MHRLIKGFAGKKILVVGDVMLDRYISGSVERISPEAPVPVVLMEEVAEMPGGCGNVARNLTALGASVIIAGAVGADPEGETLVKLLHRDDVDTAGLVKVAGRPTVLKTRIVSGHQQLLRIDREKAGCLDGHGTAQMLALVEAAKHDVDGVIISDYNKGVINSQLMEALGRMFPPGSVPVVVDPKPQNAHLIKGVDVIKPNHRELEAMAGKKIPDPAGLEMFCRELMARRDCRAVLVTRGQRGMVLVEREGPCSEIPAQRSEVYDVSGAGDTVCAVLTLCICSGMSLRDAARVAGRAASLVVRKPGTAVVRAEELAGCL